MYNLIYLLLFLGKITCIKLFTQNLYSLFIISYYLENRNVKISHIVSSKKVERRQKNILNLHLLL